MKIKPIKPDVPKPKRIRIPPRRHADPGIPNYSDPNKVATRSRFRRKTERWTGFDEASRLAQIVVLQHGGHKRPIITRGGKHLRSRMGSRKTGLQQIVEGRGHRDLTMLNEIDPQVLDFQAHPFEIRFQSMGVFEIYYPDHIRLMRDGTIELIEVKRTPADLTRPGYREKLGKVAEIARCGGWKFRVLFHGDIAGPLHRMKNVQAIYGRRFMLTTRTEQNAISAFVAAGLPCSWAELRTQACPSDCRRGTAILENAIALSRISINFDEAITEETVVMPVQPMRTRRDIRI